MFIQPPPMPGFIEPMMPFERAAWRFERGPEAGRTMHFIDCGPRDGQPVWMQHGNPTWCFLYRKIIERLTSRGFRCVAPDLLGFGLSTMLPSASDHTLTRHTDALWGLMQALDLRRVVLVGQDWGGPLIAGLGARDPSRIAGVVLGNTSVLAPRKPRGTAFHRFAHAPIISDLVFRGLSFPQTVLSRAQGDRGSIQGEVARAYRWPLRKLKDRAGPVALARMVPNGLDHPSMAPLREGEAFLRGFEGPMAMVWGDRDPILGKVARRHIEAFPQAPIVHTDAGHFLQEEVPDEIAEAISQVARRAEARATT